MPISEPITSDMILEGIVRLGHYHGKDPHDAHLILLERLEQDLARIQKGEEREQVDPFRKYLQ